MCSVQGPTRPEPDNGHRGTEGCGVRGLMGSQTGTRGQVKVLCPLKKRREGGELYVPPGMASDHEEVAVARRMGVGYTGKNLSPGSIRDPRVSLGHRVTKRVKNLAGCEGLCSAQDSFLQLANKPQSAGQCPVAVINAPGWGRGHAGG